MATERSMDEMQEDQPKETLAAVVDQAEEYTENLNMIETQNPPNTNLRYIEYNDGKVCWYYPIFPAFPEAYPYQPFPIATSTPLHSPPNHSFYTVFNGDHQGTTAVAGGGCYPSYSEPGSDGTGDEDWKYQLGSEFAANSAYFPYEGSTMAVGQDFSVPNPHYFNHSLFYQGEQLDDPQRTTISDGPQNAKNVN